MVEATDSIVKKGAPLSPLQPKKEARIAITAFWERRAVARVRHFDKC